MSGTASVWFFLAALSNATAFIGPTAGRVEPDSRPQGATQLTTLRSGISRGSSIYFLAGVISVTGRSQ